MTATGDHHEPFSCNMDGYALLVSFWREKGDWKDFRIGDHTHGRDVSANQSWFGGLNNCCSGMCQLRGDVNRRTAQVTCKIAKRDRFVLPGFYTADMIRVRMGDHNCIDFLPWDAKLLQVLQGR